MQWEEAEQDWKPDLTPAIMLQLLRLSKNLSKTAIPIFYTVGTSPSGFLRKPSHPLGYSFPTAGVVDNLSVPPAYIEWVFSTATKTL